MKPKNISLALYMATKARLNKARFPHTFTLTRWINEAICDKLDREHPETVGVSHMEEQPLSPVIAATAFDPLAERRRLNRLQRGPNYVGPYILKYRGTTPYDQAVHLLRKQGSGSQGIEAILEDMCLAAGEPLSIEEQGAIMAADRLKSIALLAKEEKEAKDQAQEVEALKAAAMEESPLVNVAAPAMEDVPTAKLAEDEEDEFWGSYDKIKAMARKI